MNNFLEVEKTMDKKEAIDEASRCLNCVNPRCVGACPVGINIPAFIREIKNDNVDEAYRIILESNSLPKVCGRVCPQERQCEGSCIRGFKEDAIKIGNLERYAADNGKVIEENILEKNGKKVLIVGSGPSGLTCAGELIKKGFDVTIYESLHEAGGVLTYGIPEFRLPKAIIKSEVDRLKQMGVNIVLNVVVGKTFMIEDLLNEFDFIYIATGAGLPKFMGIPGEDANGVLSANEVLTRINLMDAANSVTPIIKNKKVFVVGGGNVACDAARSLKRLGNDVKVLYRRTVEEMPARKKEIDHLLSEGIEIIEHTLPLEIIKNEDNFIKSIKVIKLDSTLNKIDGSEEDLECDAIIMALGNSINNIVLNNSNIITNEGLIEVNENFKTNLENVYAGGDVISGSATVIKACEAGKKAANYINLAIK